MVPVGRRARSTLTGWECDSLYFDVMVFEGFRLDLG